MKRKLYDSQNKEDIIAFIHSDLLAARQINPRWYSDKEIAMHMVAVWGNHIDLLPKQLKADRSIAKRAILQAPTSIRYLCKELRNDPELRTLAFRKAGHCFIVDPLALMVFSVYDSILLRETGKNEEKTKNHPIYQKFKSIYDSDASSSEIREFEEFLLKNKNVFLICLSRKGKDLTKLSDEELEEIDFTKF